VGVSPFANKLDPALLLMAAILLLLTPVAIVTLLRMEPPVFEVWLFLPMLALSVAIGLLNGHEPANVARGTIPYLIYIVTFAAILSLPPEKRLSLVRLFVIVAALLSLKTLAILAYNGVGPDKIMHGVRATYYDINSGLPMAMAALPFALVCFRSGKARAILAILLVLQVLLGQSKSLMVATAVFLVVFAISYVPRPRRISIRASTTLIKTLGVVVFAAVTILTFNKNPLMQRFILMVSSPQTELAGRLYEIKNVMRAMEQNPLLGRGQGYVFLHKSALSQKGKPRFEKRRYTHSILFYHLAIMGLLGMPLALLLLHGPVFYLIWHTFNPRRRPFVLRGCDGTPVARLSMATILSGLGMLAFNLVSASYKNPQSLIVLALINALCFTLLAGNGRPSETGASSDQRIHA